MDRLIVLDKGQIVGAKAPTEGLIHNRGIYAQLWAHQTGGFIGEQNKTAEAVKLTRTKSNPLVYPFSQDQSRYILAALI